MFSIAQWWLEWQKTYCETLKFSCILIWRFWSVEISLHFNLAFSKGVLCLQGSSNWLSHVNFCEQNCALSSPVATTAVGYSEKKIFTNGVDIQCRWNIVMGNPNFRGYFNFTVICYSRSSWKLYACKKLVFYSIYKWCYRRDVSFTDWWNRSVCLSTGPIHSSNWRLSNIDRQFTVCWNDCLTVGLSRRQVQMYLFSVHACLLSRLSTPAVQTVITRHCYEPRLDLIWHHFKLFLVI